MSDLLVAVDGSEANQAALDWAIDAAERAQASLSIAVVVEPWQVPDLDPPDEDETDYVRPIVNRASEAATARLGADRVDALVLDGPPLSVLVHVAEDHSGIVVGRRGVGAISRILIGSTSIAVAGRSPVPVTVVPDAWDVSAAADRPVLLGLDMEEEHDAAVRRAFSEAQTRGVGLRVLQAWRTPPVFGATAGAQVAYFAEWREVCLEALRAYIERMGQEFAEVEVTVDQVVGHPVDALVEGAEDAQLVVLGRNESSRWTGFALGSVARSVLPLCPVPVTVVPLEPAPQP